MFEKNPNEEQLKKITGIVDRYVREARTSSKETAWPDAKQKGMHAVIDFCNAQGLTLLGDHMVRAEFKLSDR
jgi:hypothetical protein